MLANAPGFATPPKTATPLGANMRFSFFILSAFMSFSGMLFL